MRVSRTARRVWAFLMTVVMVLSTIVVGKAPDSKAAPQGYTVNINLFDYDATTPYTPEEPLKSKKDDGPFYVVAKAIGGQNPGDTDWTTYAVKKVDSLDADTTTVTFDAADFRIDVFSDPPANTQFDHNDYNESWWQRQGHFDTDHYHMDSVTLYRVKDGINDWEVRTDNISLEDMIAQFERDDAAPEGFMFDGVDKYDNNATIKLHRSEYTPLYELRMSFEGDGGAISADDGYIAILKVEHTTGPETYYFTDNIETTGNGATLTFPVGETDWFDQNGNPKPKEKFTGKEPNRTVYLVKLKDGVARPSNPDLKSMQASQVIVLSAGDSVGRYSYEGVTPGSEEDDTAHTKTYYDELKFTAVPVDTSYNFLTILGESANYGVTANSMDTQGHFESNFATNSFTAGTSNFDPDLSNDGTQAIPGTFLVGEIADGAEVHFGTRTPPTAYVITTDAAAAKVLSDAEAGNVVTATTDQDKINDAVNGMIGYMQAVSADLLTKPMTSFPGAGTESLVVDITAYPENAVVYLDGDKYLKAIKTSGGVHIKCKDSQLVVFNFDEATDVEIGKVLVNEYDSNTVLYEWDNLKNHQADYVAQHVVWNLASATNVNLKEAGGIYLLPDDSSYIDAGGTSSGWVVSAGHAHMGNGEFHFVYGGLTQNSKVNLSLRKLIDGAKPTDSQVFTFVPEKYDPDTKAFDSIMVSDGEGGQVALTVNNSSNVITIPVTEMNEGQNVIKITENKKNGFKTNNQEFYAVFNVTVITVGGADIKIPGAVSYYTSFDAATGTASDKVSSNPTFNNETLENSGKIQIVKTIKGDVTEEDLNGLKFEIFDQDDVLIETVMLSQFHKGNPDSAEVKDTYTYTLDVDATKTYYVVETLTTMTGFTVVVKNEVGVTEVTDGADTVEAPRTNDITVSTGNTTNVAYENDYTFKPVSTDIEATKTLTDLSRTGKTLAANDYTFALIGSGLAIGTNIEKTNAADGTVAFGTFNYDTPGEYIYTIREKAGTEEGITYSQDEYVVTVKVEHVTDGTGLSLTKTVTKNGAAYTGDIAFENTYEEVQEKGYINITKTISGDVTEEDLSGLVFTIMKGDQEVATRQLGTDFEVVNGKYQLKADRLIEAAPGDNFTVIETLTNNMTGFDVVVKNEIGVTEVSGGAATTTSETTAQFSVVNGQVTEVAYENKYTFKPVSTDIEATKTLTVVSGTKTLAANAFDFTLTGSGDAVGVSASAKNAADGTVDFGTFNYDTPGEYIYTIQETAGTEEGITYSQDEYVVTVKVEHVTDGTGLSLTKTVTKNGAAYTGDIAFENTYAESKGYINITKTISGDVTEEDLSGLVFTIKKGDQEIATRRLGEDFEVVNGKYQLKANRLIEVAPGDNYTVIETLTNNMTGFDVVVKNEIGVTEVSNGAATVTSETTAQFSVINGQTTEVAYENKYTFKPVSTDIEATKTLTVVSGTKTLAANAFDFTLTGSGDAVGVSASAKNAADGTVDFGTFNYDTPGEYIYTIQETAGTEEGITYSQDEYVVTVKVEHVTDGTGLSLTKTVTKNGAAYTGDIAFENTYAESKGYINITKTISGDVTEEDLSGLVFTIMKGDQEVATRQLGTDFEVVNGKYQLKVDRLIEAAPGDNFTVIETLTNNMTGFDVVVKNEIGVTEVSGGAATTTSETTAQFSVVNGQVTEVAYENKYTFKPVSTDIELTKTLTGKAMTANEFSFVLAGQGLDVGTTMYVPNEADGKVSFGTFNFETVGTHVYTIQEQPGDETGITYSEDVYEVTITVTNAKDGTGLSLEKTVKKNNAAYTGDITFENTYEVPEGKGQLSVTKTISGTAIPKTEFKITIKKNDKFLNASGELVDADPGLTVTAGVPLLINNVPTGEYTVTEDTEDARVEGYTLITDGSATATVIKDQTVTAQLTNEYTRDLGNLEITKAFDGDKPDDSLLTGLTFTVTGPDGFNREFTYPTDFPDGKLTLENIPTGKYTVVESGTGDVDDGKHTYFFDAAGSQTTVENEDVTKGATTAVTITNKYEKEELGKLTITKNVVVNGNAPADIEAKAEDKAYKVQIKNEAGKFINADGEAVNADPGLTVKQTAMLVIEDLPFGKYTIAEVSGDINNVDATLTLDETSSTTGYSGNDAIELHPAEKEKICGLTNVYDYEANTGKLTVHVTEKNSGKDVPDAEVQVKYPDDSVKTFKTNDKGEIKDDNGNDVVVPAGDYEITVTKVPEGYDVTTGETGTVTVPKNGEGHHDAIIETDRGAIVITVLDEETGEPVPNATVEVTQPDGTTKTFKTDSNGQITDYAKKDEYGNYTAETGDYTFKVTEVPTGYHVTVGEEQTDTVVTGKLTELEAKIAIDTGKLTVHVKEEKSGLDVPNAEVEITYPDGSKKTYTTDDKGEVKDANGNDLIVPAGDYKVTVTKVPEGYDVTTGETGTVTVPKNDEGHHDAVIATDRGGIVITVLDEETGKPVPNATVEVTQPDGTKKTYTTDENGQITDYAKKDSFGNYTAEPGDYTFKVTEVPTGYHVTVGEEQTDTVVAGKLKELEAKIAPQPADEGGLTVIVLDEETGLPVPGATITVKKGEDVFTGKTDKDGRVTFNPIPTGEYTITITDVPTGYSVTTGDGGKKTVVNGKVTDHEIKIIPKKPDADSDGGMTIVVIDEVTGKVVPNAVLEITHKKDKSIKFTKTTDKNGKVTLNPIPTGDYTVEVKSVPEGYTVSKDLKLTTVVSNKISEYEIKITTEKTATNTATKEQTPKTGDDTPVRLHFLLMLISAAAATGLFFVKKKKKGEF